MVPLVSMKTQTYLHYLDQSVRRKSSISGQPGDKKIALMRPPWQLNGEGSACQCRRHRFDPWFPKIPHAMEQLSPGDIATEPERLEPVLRNERSHCNEKPAHRDLSKALEQRQRPSAAKNNK